MKKRNNIPAGYYDKKAKRGKNKMVNYAIIPVIVVICYVVISAIKTTNIKSKWFPLISCALGAVLAVAMFYIVPDFVGAATLTAAIISGAVSGLAATGTNQIFKQLMKAAESGEDITKIELPGFSESGEGQKERTPVHNGGNAGNDTGTKM